MQKASERHILLISESSVIVIELFFWKKHIYIVIHWRYTLHMFGNKKSQVFQFFIFLYWIDCYDKDLFVDEIYCFVKDYLLISWNKWDIKLNQHFTNGILAQT